MEVGPRASGNAMYSTELWGNDVSAVLGQFLDAKTRRVYETLAHDYCDRTDEISRTSVMSTLEVMEIPEVPGDTLRELHPRFKKNFASVVDTALLNNGKRFPIRKRELLLKHLPRDLPCSDLLEVYKVPTNDPRVPLRGQNGLRLKNKRSLPAGSFLGIYRGRSLIGLDEYKDISNAPDGVNHLEFELEIESYTASATRYNIGLEAVKNGTTFEGLNLNEPGDSEVHVCAARYGNLTALVNDPTINPMSTSDEKVGIDNTSLVEVLVGGWPCLVMFASKTIKPGEELRYIYGGSFWSFVRAAARRVENNARLLAGNNGRAAAPPAAPPPLPPPPPPAAAVPAADDAVTPVRGRPQPASEPLEAAENSDLEPTEELGGGGAGGDGDDDNADDDRGASSKQMQNSRKRKPQKQRKEVPTKKSKYKPMVSKTVKPPAAQAVPVRSPFPTPTKKMLASPHGKRVKIYSRETDLGYYQVMNNGYASPKQFEAAQRLVEENPRIDSGAETDSEIEEAIARRKERTIKAVPLEGLSASKLKATKRGRLALMKIRAERRAAARAAGPSAWDTFVGSLRNAVETKTSTWNKAKRMLKNVEILVNTRRRKLAELKPEEEEENEDEEEEEQAQAPQPPPPQPQPQGPSTSGAPTEPPRLPWTIQPLFYMFALNETGGEDLVGPWTVSQLEEAFDSNKAPADREVFIQLGGTDDGDDSDSELREALESLGPLPESGMWKLAELLDAAHPEALAAEAETPQPTPAAAPAAHMKRAAKRKAKKRLNAQQARALREAEKELEKALEEMKEKEEAVKEEEEALAAAQKELQQALGEEEDADDDDGEDEEEEGEEGEGEDKEEEESDPEVAKILKRSAGKRPAVDNGDEAAGDEAAGPSGSGYAGRANGNGVTPRGAKSPRLTPACNGNGTANGAGTSAARTGSQRTGVWAALSPSKTSAGAAAAADDVVDLTFDAE